MSKIKEAIKATINEIKAISWPPRKRVYTDTLIVLAALVGSGLVIALLDYIFGSGFKLAITKIEELNIK
jgi:preprotein translocase SecE subunit